MSSELNFNEKDKCTTKQQQTQFYVYMLILIIIWKFFIRTAMVEFNKKI